MGFPVRLPTELPWAKKERLQSWHKLLLAAGGVMVMVGGLLGLVVWMAYAQKAQWAERNQARARAMLETLNQQLADYERTHHTYPVSLEEIFISELGRGRDRFERNGYLFGYNPGAPLRQLESGRPKIIAYWITAEPTTLGATGEWFYYTDERGEIRGRRREPASADDPVVE